MPIIDECDDHIPTVKTCINTRIPEAQREQRIELHEQAMQVMNSIPTPLEQKLAEPYVNLPRELTLK